MKISSLNLTALGHPSFSDIQNDPFHGDITAGNLIHIGFSEFPWWEWSHFFVVLGKPFLPNIQIGDSAVNAGCLKRSQERLQMVVGLWVSRFFFDAIQHGQYETPIRFEGIVQTKVA